MEAGFRASMNWLHTWSGVVLGSLLFAIFWMGTLSVFDREIDKWMAPMTRLAVPDEPVSIDALRPSIAEAAAARSPFWSLVLPTERQPTLRVLWRKGGEPVSRHLDPATGAPLADPETLAASRFFYPFHYMLHIRVWQLGTWIVGLAGMAMLALCVTGVIIHRKIFTDFFTFRRRAQPRRLVLDLHNLAGVLGLPFHMAITLSGLIIFNTVYFPGIWQIAYQNDRKAFGQEAFGLFERPRANRPGTMASIDAMAAEARRMWDGAPVRSLVVRFPGDAAAYVQIGRHNEDRVIAALDVASFDAATGLLLHQRTGAPPLTTAQRFISGFHLIQFRHWTLRWLYFGLGLTGCALIATGFLFWLESRRRGHAEQGRLGVPIVEGLTIGSVTGIIAATLAFFAVNRLLPLGTNWLGQDRAVLEVWVFYLVWILTFGHAWLRPGRAWREQCRAIAALALAAVLLNWITTGHHLGRSLSDPSLLAVAGMDIGLLVGAVLAVLAARRTGGDLHVAGRMRRK